MLKAAICDLFHIVHPIIQGGMAHLGTFELVSAVSNAGGLGIIGAGHYQPGWLEQQIRLTRQHTSKPFGVNIHLTSPYAERIVEVVLTEKVAVVTTAAGNPEPYFRRFHQAGIKIAPVISSVNMARDLERAGADAIIAEGTESGGHIGETTTMVLIPQVVDSVKIPVIAAGGIADGRGLVAALALGARGIQMGTRFACSQECIAHHRYKQKIIEAHNRATVVTRQANGLPLRSLQNKLTDELLLLEKTGAPGEALEAFLRGRMYLGMVEGDTDEGWLLAGQIAGLIKEIKPVKIIIEEIVAESEMIITSLGKFSTEGTI
ncbi:MAG: DUF561 domain-containing protein [Chloroflexi bacterium]|nr:DUF561 domain-containing protein [Chloroflexota bacterium]